MHVLLDNYFSFIRRLLPTQSQSSNVGIDIGISECKLIELKKSANTFELLHVGVEHITGDAKATVQKMLQSLQNATPRTAYTSVSGRGTLIRYLEVPRMSLNDFRQSLTIESDKYFPFAQDQIYTDCYVLDSQAKAPQMSVLAAAAKRNIIDQRIKLLSDLGFAPNFIGIDSIAIANVIQMLGLNNEEDRSAAYALLDLGEVASSLMIFVNRLPYFTRDIYIGGQDFTKRISNALGISFKEAETLKIHPKEKLPQVMTACEDSINNIIQEIRISFDYFSTEKNKEVSRLYLTGGSSKFNGIAEVLEKNLEIKVEDWNPFQNVKIGPKLSPEDINKNSHKLAVALGLALYEI